MFEKILSIGYILYYMKSKFLMRPKFYCAHVIHISYKWLHTLMACRILGAKPLPTPMLLCLSIGPPGTNFSEILIKIQNFSFTKNNMQISSAKWRPFCPGGDELNPYSDNSSPAFPLASYTACFLGSDDKICAAITMRCIIPIRIYTM